MKYIKIYILDIKYMMIYKKKLIELKIKFMSGMINILLN